MTSRSFSELLSAAERARTAYDWEEAIARYTEALALPHLSPEQRYELHDGRAFCFRFAGEYELCYDDAAVIGALGREADNGPWHLDGLTKQALALVNMGHIERARTVASKARRAAKEAALPFFAARAQYVLGNCHLVSGEYEDAARRFGKAMAVFQELGALREEADCADRLAFCASYTGRDGRPLAQRVLEIARILDDRLIETDAYHILGIVDEDDPIRTLSYREKALELSRTINSGAFISSSTGNLGVLILNLGLYKRAQAMFTEAWGMHEAEAAPSRYRHVLKLHYCALAAFLLGRLEEGWALNERAIDEAREGGRKEVEAFARQVRGRMLHRMGHSDAARDLLTEAVEIMQTAPRALPFALGELAYVCLETGDVTAALEKSEEAVQRLDELSNPDYTESVPWFRYRALRAAADAGLVDVQAGQEYLDRAQRAVATYAEKLYDRGLRRSYLTSDVYYVRSVVLDWAKEAHKRGESSDVIEEQALRPDHISHPFKRLLDFGARLTAQAPDAQADEMQSFILDEFVELSGAERAFLALRADGDEDLPPIVAGEGIDDVDQKTIYKVALPLVEKALLARHAVLAQGIGDVPAGEPPALHRRSLLVVPLVSPTRVLGVLYGDIREIFGPFTREDADLLTMLANHAAVALENAAWTQTLEERVAERTEALEAANEQLAQQNAELAVINSVQRGLVARVDMDAIYELVGEQIRQIFDAQSVGIGTFEGEPLHQVVHYLVEDGERYPKQTLPLGKLGQLMVAEGRSFLMETGQDFIDLGLQTVEGTQPALSGVFVPILHENEVWGGMTIQNVDREYAFSRADVRLLETLAHATSLALQNARLFDETQRRAREMSALTEVGQDISSTLELTAVLERIASHARELLQVSDSAVFLPDETSEIMRAVVALGPIAQQVRATEVRCGQGIVGDLWQRREAEYVNDASHDPRAITIAGTEWQPDERLMVAPLLSGERVTGMMVVWRSGGESFANEDLRFLQGLARQASIALENARLYAVAQEARAAAEAANASKSAFLANVSHELRTPLTSILGFTRIVQKRLDERVFPQLTDEDAKVERAMAQVRKNLEIVLNEGERLTTLINNVLDLEKIESGQVEWRMAPVSLSEVAEQALQATSALVQQAGLSLVKELPRDLPLVTGDRDRLVQVMINLISNAVKFTNQGRISCCVRAENGAVLAMVSDTGVGIAPQDIDTVFEKFRQVGDTLTGKPAGTGLGLPICKEIIEHHGGRIWVESVLGEGSTFQFTIPISEGRDS